MEAVQLAFVCFVSLMFLVQGQNPASLSVSTQPGGGTGGLAWSVQPVVQVLDSSGDLVTTQNSGTVEASINSNPAGFASLQSNSVVTATFVGGIATFSGLYINEIGLGFTLQLVSIDVALQVETAAFNITLGPPSSIRLTIPPGTATGGVPFKPQPAVAVVDAGGNTVTSDSVTTFAVTVQSAPVGATLSSTELNPFNVTCVNGVAVFKGLKFDLAGQPFVLRFTTSAAVSTTYVDTGGFTVGVGIAHTLEIRHQPTGARGGIALTEQPQLFLRDAGGNVLVDDSVSLLTVAIQNNPSGGSLSGDDIYQNAQGVTVPLTRQLVQGTANFSALTIDKIGLEYTLLFTVTAGSDNPYLWTGTVTATSNTLDVLLGEPTALQVVTAPGDAWAGGQPFGVQPSVALLDAGGNVMTPDSVNTVTATLTVSPLGFPLLGQSVVTLAQGVASYTDLQIEQRATGYTLQFSTSAGNFTASSVFEVAFSSEFEASSSDKQPGDLLGQAVDVRGGVAVLGAPGDDRPVDEVQIISTHGDATALAAAVQQVSTGVLSPQPDVQRILVTASTGASVGGGFVRGTAASATATLPPPSFRLSWSGLLSRPIPYDARPSSLAHWLQEDFAAAAVGQVVVSRATNSACGCSGAYTWLVTFATLRGFVPQMTVNSSAMWAAASVGGGSSSVSVTVSNVQWSTVIGGSFKLTMPALYHNGHAERVAPPASTPALPYNATAAAVAAAVSSYLWAPGATVTRSAVGSAMRGFTWTVTFTPTHALFRPPLLGVDTSSLTGHSVTSNVIPLAGGAAPIGGAFRLSFRSAGACATAGGAVVAPCMNSSGAYPFPSLSEAIPYNASAATVRAALLGLGTVQSVAVSRSGPSAQRGYSWTVTFTGGSGGREGEDAVRAASPYGFLLDTVGNLMPLHADDTTLSGLNAHLRVDYLFAHATPNARCADDFSNSEGFNLTGQLPPAVAVPAGGVGSGAAAQYEGLQRLDGLQRQPFCVLPQTVMGSAGSDAGAAYVMLQVGERWLQEIKLRGTDTNAGDRFGTAVSISGNATGGTGDGTTIVVGAPGAEDHGVNERQSLLCSAGSHGLFKLGFRGVWTPYMEAADITVGGAWRQLEALTSITSLDVAGADVNATLCSGVTLLITFISPAEGNMEALSTETTRLTGTLVITDDVVPGSKQAYGVNAQGLQTGAAYVFTRSGVSWAQQAKVMAGDRTAGDDFGYSVDIDGDTMVIGAPNDRTSREVAGSVYVFLRSTDAATGLPVWRQSQKLIPYSLTLRYSIYTGIRFGHSVSISGDTIVVGELPVAYAIRTTRTGAAYVFKRNAGDANPFVPDQLLQAPDGAPGDAFGCSVEADGDTIVVGAHGASTGGQEAGAAYVFYRSHTYQHYTLQQTLQQRARRERARFGRAVAVHGDTVVAAAHPLFRGALTPRKEVQSIRSSADPGATIGNVFYVTWHDEQRVVQAALAQRAGGSRDALPRGVRVHARWRGGILFYPGRVTRTNVDRTVAILYDNGDFERSVARTLVVRHDRLLRHTDPRQLWTPVHTSALPHNIDAETLRTTLQRELGTGELAVTRSDADVEGGYTWSVTFLGAGGKTALASPSGARSVIGWDGFEGDDGQAVIENTDVAQLGAVSALTGDGATIETATVSAPNRNIDSMAAVFTRTNGVWTEQATLAPQAPQPADLFAGGGVAVYTGVAVVGAPNRDTFVPGTNAGVGYVFDLGFLNLAFANTALSALESAGNATLTIQRCTPACRSGTAASSQNVQYTIGDGPPSQLTPIRPAPGTLAGEGGCRSRHGCRSTASGRADCPVASVGYHHCRWIPGDGVLTEPSFYDARARSDYAPAAGGLVFPALGTSLELQVTITDDMVLEVPDEFVNVRLSSPGVRPSYGGDLWAVVTIVDDGDGGSGTSGYYDKLLSGTAANTAAEDKFGNAVAVYQGVALVACQAATVNGLPQAGHVDAWALTSGVWSLETRLVSPMPTAGGRFGSSLDLHYEAAVVGAEGEVAAYIFSRLNQSGTIVWTANATLRAVGPDGCERPGDGFAGEHSVALHEGTAVVGARGVEAAYVFQATAGWNRTARIEAADVIHQNLHRVRRWTRAEFGASVDIWSDTIIVGSPLWGVHDGGYPERGCAYIFLQLSNGSWVQQAMLRAQDGRTGDLFGFDVAIDYDQVLVGAPGDDLFPRTTWDFEDGTLTGWTRTGDAFDYQPTLGDNTMARKVYGFMPSAGAVDVALDELRSETYSYVGKLGQPSRHNGQYWVGTKERRPDAATAAGTEQGDAPQGTLTSDPFVIRGDSMSFLIGGGCEITEEYVELLVDTDAAWAMQSVLDQGWAHQTDSGTLKGRSVLRATGKCSETMERVHWDVRRYYNMTARLRVVDRSSHHWAHINFDDVRFDWEQYDRQRTSERQWGPNPCGNGRDGCDGVRDSGKGAGAAYAFRRRDPTQFVTVNGRVHYQPCAQVCTAVHGCLPESGADRWPCVWEQQAKLHASDRRAGDQFGRSVAYEETSTLGVVGAYLSRSVDPFNRDSSMVWWHTVDAAAGGGPDDGRSGAVYLFKHSPEQRDGQALLLMPPQWDNVETVKIQSADKRERQWFGHALALNGEVLMVGAPYDSANHFASGAAFAVDARFAGVSFRYKETVVSEGTSRGVADIIITRTDTTTALTIGYATSDVTAVGMNAVQYAECDALSRQLRGKSACADYLQTSGEVTFLVSESEKRFAVPILDDMCHEFEMEYIALRLLVPGGDALIGENYLTHIRIDDDDDATLRSTYCA